MGEQTELNQATIPSIQNRKKEHKSIVNNRISELGIISWIPGVRRILNPLFRGHLAKDLRIDRLKAKFHIDHLTQIPNETAFEETYVKEVTRARRTGQPLVMFYGDLDNFKTINDKHGHNTGDQVLRSVATLLKNGIRPYDTTARITAQENQANGAIYRLHGDEFAMLFPDTSLENAQLLWLRQKTALSKLRIESPIGSINGIKMSVGAILVNPADSLQASLKKADQLMYQSKKEGLGNLHAVAEATNT